MAVRVVVATFAKVFTPEKYGMLPMTAAVLVERPLNPTVTPERVIGHVTLIVACLLLKVFQSVDERYPFVATPDCVMVNAPVPELYASGAEAESEVEDILLLKSPQSAEERHPACEPEAVWHPTVRAVPPTSEPKVPDVVSGLLMVKDDVATDCRPPVPLP